MGQIDYQKVVDLFKYNAEAPLIFNSGLFLFLFTGFYIIYYFLRHKKVIHIPLSVLWTLTLIGTFLFYYFCSTGIINWLKSLYVFNFYFFKNASSTTLSILAVITSFIANYTFFLIFLRKPFNLKFLYVFLFSLFFYYKSSGLFFLFLVICTLVDFYVGLRLDKTTTPYKRTLYLILVIVYNLGILFYFKYTNFFGSTIADIMERDFEGFDFMLPVGISFYTFQSLSYTIDVYRRHLKPIDNILDYGFFLIFFPQLVAGPIVRAVDFLPQLKRPTFVSNAMLGSALFLIAGGLFKKAVIADYISLNFVDRIFENPTLYSGVENLFGVYGYALQIYCDFSGYSDMAIGIALLLGYHFNINFNSPYQSQSITEFWRRWHISLSTWLRDYLYISMGGNRKGSFAGYFFTGLFFVIIWGWSIMVIKTTSIPLIVTIILTLIFILSFILQPQKTKALANQSNLMTTMLLGGLWHGATMQFIVWGALHGLALCFHKVWLYLFPPKHKSNPVWRKITVILSLLITFHFVCFCWIFFRAQNMDIVWEMLTQIWTKFTLTPAFISEFISGYKVVLILMLIGYILHFIPNHTENKYVQFLTKLPLVVKAIYLIIVIMIVIQFKSADVQPFIYFQF